MLVLPRKLCYEQKIYSLLQVLLSATWWTTEQLHYYKSIRYHLNTQLPPKWVEYSDIHHNLTVTGLDIFQGIYIKNRVYGKKVLPLKGLRYKNAFMYGYFTRKEITNAVFCARNEAKCKSKIRGSHSTVSSRVQSSIILLMDPSVSKKRSTSLDCSNLDNNCSMFLQNTGNHLSNDTPSYP